LTPAMDVRPAPLDAVRVRWYAVAAIAAHGRCGDRDGVPLWPLSAPVGLVVVHARCHHHARAHGTGLGRPHTRIGGDRAISKSARRPCMSTASWATCTARPTALTATHGTTPTMPRTLERTCSGRPLCRERDTQRERDTERERETHTHTYTDAHAYTHMHKCVRAHTHTCMGTHTYTHVVWVVPLRLSTMSHGALMRMRETRRRCQWRPPALPQTLPGCPRHSARARDRPMAEPRPYMGAQSVAPLSLPHPNPDRGDRHRSTTCDTAPSFTVAAGLIIRAGAVLNPLCATVCLARTP
jgi:hypothetical protein